MKQDWMRGKKIIRLLEWDWVKRKGVSQWGKKKSHGDFWRGEKKRKTECNWRRDKEGNT